MGSIEPEPMVPSDSSGHIPNGDIYHPKLPGPCLRNPNASAEDARTVQTVRGLVVDCVQQYEMGHGGESVFVV